MVKRKYYSKFADEKNTAKAFFANRPISLKYSTELCREIKGKPVEKIERFLQRIINQEEFLPLRKYTRKIGHRKGNAKSFTKTGRFPKKTCQSFLELLELAKANADFKGLDTEKLIVKDAFASQGFRRISYQPKGQIAGKRRKKKSTHLEIVVQEVKM